MAGFFEDADVDVNEIPDDPFGFGNDYWPVRIIEIKNPKLTADGDKYGMMVKWIVDHPKYANHFVGKTGLGNGNWVQLPVPKVLQEQGVPWNPKLDEKHAQALWNLRELYKALGFSADEMARVGKEDMLHRGALARIKPFQNDEGFWNFRLNGMKPLPKDGSPEGLSEFSSGNSAPAGKTPEQLLEEELKNS